MSLAEGIMASATAFITAGVYQTLDCGCFLTAHEIDPRGPSLCYVHNLHSVCKLPHSLDDFMPLKYSETEVYAEIRAERAAAEREA